MVMVGFGGIQRLGMDAALSNIDVGNLARSQHKLSGAVKYF